MALLGVIGACSPGAPPANWWMGESASAPSSRWQAVMHASALIERELMQIARRSSPTAPASTAAATGAALPALELETEPDGHLSRLAWTVVGGERGFGRSNSSIGMVASEALVWPDREAREASPAAAARRRRCPALAPDRRPAAHAVAHRRAEAAGAASSRSSRRCPGGRTHPGRSPMSARFHPAFSRCARQAARAGAAVVLALLTVSFAAMLAAAALADFGPRPGHARRPPRPGPGLAARRAAVDWSRQHPRRRCAPHVTDHLGRSGYHRDPPSPRSAAIAPTAAWAGDPRPLRALQPSTTSRPTAAPTRRRSPASPACSVWVGMDDASANATARALAAHLQGGTAELGTAPAASPGTAPTRRSGGETNANAGGGRAGRDASSSCSGWFPPRPRRARAPRRRRAARGADQHQHRKRGSARRSARQPEPGRRAQPGRGARRAWFRQPRRPRRTPARRCCPPARRPRARRTQPLLPRHHQRRLRRRLISEPAGHARPRVELARHPLWYHAMTTTLMLLAGERWPQDPVADWVLLDAARRPLDHGRSDPRHWPAADRHEIVLAGSLVIRLDSSCRRHRSASSRN